MLEFQYRLDRYAEGCCCAQTGERCTCLTLRYIIVAFKTGRICEHGNPQRAWFLLSKS